MAGQLEGARIKRLALHLIGIVALMWPALLNGQPFFFSDTTAYVRAADLAVQIASGHHIRTAWSRPAPASQPARAAPSPNTPASAAAPARVHAGAGENGGAVMAGRSPYFGLLLYLAYVLSNFWLFVLGQAIVAWWLIGLAQRCFGCRSLPLRLGIAVALALLTPLSVYLGFLLADALAGYGILAFVIVTRPPSDLARWEMPALVALLLVSAASHFTHVVILAGMTGVLGLLALVRAIPWREARTPILIGVAVTVTGALSVMLTSLLVAKALGRPPAAAPVMTARVILDGPGKAFIANDCGGGRRFAACTRPTSARDSDVWLWTENPRVGGFRAADPATRDALSTEDARFAVAVWRAYPLWQTGMMAANTWRQLTRFDLLILDEHCFANHACSGVDIPAATRATMADTLSGRDLWPMRAMADLHVAITLASLIALVLALWTLRKDQPETVRLLLFWIVLLAAGILINDFLGGAISNPQTRYQERIIWIVPLLAMVAGARAWGAHGRFLPQPERARPLA